MHPVRLPVNLLRHAARAVLPLAGRLAGPLVVAVAVQSAGNLLFHAVVGRYLPADRYGALGAVLAAMVMLAVPLAGLQTAASALAAGHGAGTAGQVLRTVARWSAIPAAVVLLAAPALRGYFHLDSVVEAAQLAPYLAVAAVLAAARGLLLGTGRVGAVAWTYFTGTAVRLVLGLALVVPLGVTGALAGTVAGEVASLAAAGWFLARRGHVAAGPARSLGLRAVGTAVFAATGLFLFSTVDLLLARHHLRGAESGAYVAAATVAKTTLAVPAALMSVVFPRLVSGWRSPARAGPSGVRLLGTGMLTVAGPAWLAAGVAVAAPALVLALLYGDRYAGDTGLTRLLCTVAALTAPVTVLTHAALARRGRGIALPWLGAALEVALIEAWHGSAAAVATASAAALLPTLVALAVVEGRAWAGRAHGTGTGAVGGTAQPAPTRAD